MGTFPKFSNIAGYATKTLESRKRSVYNVSKLNAWVRVTSAVSGNKGDGLTIVSNPNFRLFGAAGVSSIYGINKQSGTIGETWGGSPINPSEGQGYKPSPIIESIEIDEGAGNLSRKASFTIKCFSKDQMEVVTQYFQEPGFTVFLEWGWNTPESMKGLVKKLNATEIANFQNFKNLTDRRIKSKGQYDNYLGFITGGGIGTEGENWTIEVKCTGFTELPAYLVNGDNAGDDSGKSAKKEPDYKNLSLETDLNIKRWMFAYNALPSNRKTAEIKSLATKTDDSLRKVPMAQAVNYVNFDETITDTLNNKADGTAIGRFFGWGGAKEKGNDGKERIDVPGGTKIVGSEKFIRFGTLMKIMNQMIIKGLKIGKKTVSMEIHSEHTICSAYQNIFSTDKSKLLIPNVKTPKFSFLDAKNNTKSLEAIPTDYEDCSIEYGGRKIQFPFENSINGGSVQVGGKFYNLQYKDDTTPPSECIDKPQGEWGFLDDLYVNFDFASGIMGTSNFTVKDALYQILNGMSSAVNDLWNFQIMETTLENDKGNLKKGDQIITIQETNFTYKPKVNPYTFNLIGTDSIFKDASLNLDMSAAKMNQVIGTRLGKKINGETQPFIGKLNAVGMTDLVLKEIESKKEAPVEQKSDTEETDEELKEKNYANFLGKMGTYPKVQFEKKDIKDKFVVQEKTYASVYDDKQLLKMAKSDMEEEKGVSILLPINFTFTVHGVSGIKRGDRFRVTGIPNKYKDGFFQVLGVKHTIQRMEWTTEVEGGFRNNT
jgi:hypothetical protein